MMSKHDDLLARHRDQWSGKQAHNLTFGDINTLVELQATAIRSLAAQLEAERKAREEAERKCAQLVMDGMDEEVKLKQRAESAERRLAEVEQDARLLRNKIADCKDDFAYIISFTENKDNLHEWLRTRIMQIDAAIKESAATQEQVTQAEINELDYGSCAADPFEVTDSEGWSKNPQHWANKESAPAQSSTATVQCISGGDTLTEREVPIVGQGEIAEGAAPLEPVAWATNGYGKISLYWRDGLAIDFIPNGTTIGLYAIPEGYAVVPVEPTEANVGTYCDGWMKSFQTANLHHSDIECTEEDRVHILAGLRAMLAAGRVK
jgi:hypothetical protein